MTIKRSDTVFISSTVGEREKIKYCPICERHNVRNILSKRVYNDLELVYGQLPHDHDLWLQCFACGNVFQKNRVRQEGKLTSDIEIPKSSSGHSEEKVEKPKHQRGFNERLQQEPEIKDPEVRKALKKGAKLISYQES
jgi:hypothetical protein